MIEGLRARAKAMLTLARSRLRVASAYQTTWEDPNGRLVLEDILRKGGVLVTSHVDGDPGTSAFQEGRRSLALDIVQALRFNEAQLVDLACQQTSEELEEG